MAGMKSVFVAVLVQLGLNLAVGSDYSDSVLTNLQGVGLEVRPFNVQSDYFKLGFEEVETRAVAALQRLEVRLLSSAEVDVLPGQPYLEITIDVAHAQGPSHLYAVRLELREMARLDRAKDRIVSMALPTWERKVMGVANRPEKVVEELDRLLTMFADEFHEHNRRQE